MSYRKLKHLLGETSLERKCRFLFGGGLMLLITGSFYFYAWLNSDLVYEQNITTARLLIAPILIEKHWRWDQHRRAELSPEALDPAFNEDEHELIKQVSASLKPEGLEEYSWSILTDLAGDKPHKRPDDFSDRQAMEQLLQNPGRREVVDKVRGKGQYVYYGTVRAKPSCVSCHNREIEGSNISEGDVVGVVKISLPLQQTEKALNENYAILWTTAIVTTFLAMLAAYAIVRYVIVKPVLHLKDVADEIARGTLDLRADIRTGDEFEELSHAFNRMLRHLTTVQDELRDVNSSLDVKVDELAQVNLRLYEMNKLKDEFLATMSHELRTPLNSILGFGEVLSKSDNLSEKQARFLKNIQNSGRDLMLLINDALDLAKIESGRMDVQASELRIGDVVERQVDSLRPMAERKNIDLSTDVDAGVPPVFQDSGKLQQILNNLLSNAIKFTPEGGRVSVRAERVHADQPTGGLPDRPAFRLIVEDTGIGIPLEDQETIFEKFRQGKSVPGLQDTMTREYGGTGLGLSIVKELTKLLGGEVALDSEFGKGSTFVVRLPCQYQPPVENVENDFESSTRIRHRPSAAEGDGDDATLALSDDNAA